MCNKKHIFSKDCVPKYAVNSLQGGINMEDRKQKKFEIYKAAGERISHMRKKKGFSRDVMSTDIGISGKFLYEIEKGKKGFSSDVLLRIANYLGIGCDYIMTGRIINAECGTEMLDQIPDLDEKKKNKLIKLIKLSKEI